MLYKVIDPYLSLSYTMMRMSGRKKWVPYNLFFLFPSPPQPTTVNVNTYLKDIDAIDVDSNAASAPYRDYSIFTRR
jgi:hypothetical protein